MLVSIVSTIKKKFTDRYRPYRVSNPNISQWMKTMNITNTTGIHTYYADRILDIMREIKATPIVWQDVWDEKVEVGFIWNAQSTLRTAVPTDLVTSRHNHPSMEGCR